MDSEELRKFEDITICLESKIERYNNFHDTQGESEGISFDDYYKCLVRIMQGEDIFNRKLSNER